MNGLLNVFISVLLTFSSARLVQAQGLADDAKEQLDQLRSLVLGDIMVAHTDLNTLHSHHTLDTMSNSRGASVRIEEQIRTINAEINSIVKLAEAAGHDVSACTNIREESLDKLHDQYYLKIRECLSKDGVQSLKVRDDAKYVVDISINTVDHFEAQLRRCGGEFTCISRLLTEINLNKIRIPQNIKTEVQAVESFLTTLRVSFRNCADSNVAAYATESSTVFAEIQSCINKILG